MNLIPLAFLWRSWQLIISFLGLPALETYTLPIQLFRRSSDALITSNWSLWKQLLCHLSARVFNKLVSNCFIYCNKTSSHVKCPKFQLGKQIKLPFTSSSSNVSRCFEVFHSDLWKSSIPGTSCIKYCILFLNHFSRFIWVCLLRRKSDVFSTFLHFVCSSKLNFNDFNVITGANLITKNFTHYLTKATSHFVYNVSVPLNKIGS